MQTIFSIGERNSDNLNGRKTTHPKVFDPSRKNSSRNMTKQTDPQEPELCVTKFWVGALLWKTDQPLKFDIPQFRIGAVKPT